MEASCLGILGCRVCVPESYMSAMEDFSLLLDREAHIILGYDAQEAVARNEGQGFLVSSVAARWFRMTSESSLHLN